MSDQPEAALAMDGGRDDRNDRNYRDPDYWAFTVAEFTCGLCAELAVTLHLRHGWPLYAEWADDGGLYHAWVVNDAGRAVDINGVHDGLHARTFYDPDTRVAPTTLDALDAIGLNAEGLAWAEEILAARSDLVSTPFDWLQSHYATDARRRGQLGALQGARPGTRSGTQPPASGRLEPGRDAPGRVDGSVNGPLDTYHHDTNNGQHDGRIKATPDAIPSTTSTCFRS